MTVPPAVAAARLAFCRKILIYNILAENIKR